MKKNSLDVFGQLLMKYVRDETVSTWDRMIDGQLKGLTAQEVSKKTSDLSEEQLEVIKWMTPKIIDEGLHNLLFMFEECEELFLGLAKEKGRYEDIKEKSDGLSGELYTEDGWIKRFSKERHNEID